MSDDFEAVSRRQVIYLQRGRAACALHRAGVTCPAERGEKIQISLGYRKLLRFSFNIKILNQEVKMGHLEEKFKVVF